MRIIAFSCGIFATLLAPVAWGQQVTVTAPNVSLQSGFSEQFRVGFGLSHPNFSLQFGGPGGGAGGLAPQVGGTSVGIGLRGGSANANLSISAGQGFSRSLTTTAPMITLMNGVPGFMFSGTIEPFVTALVPVVGAGPTVSRPPAMSRVRSLLDRGEIQIQKDASGNARLVIAQPPKRRAESEPADPPADSKDTNQFRRAMDRYAGPKR